MFNISLSLCIACPKRTTHQRSLHASQPTEMATIHSDPNNSSAPSYNEVSDRSNRKSATSDNVYNDITDDYYENGDLAVQAGRSPYRNLEEVEIKGNNYDSLDLADRARGLINDYDLLAVARKSK
jgi:hypothetical protein